MGAQTVHAPDDDEFLALSNEDAFLVVGHLIDTAQDEKSSAATTRAFALLELLEQRELTEEQTSLLHYFRANAWENRIHEHGKQQSWEWEQPDLQNQILELRRAIRHDGFSELDKIRRCQILTNLANKLSSVGRIIEAIELWDRAIDLEPRFAMALGNRANGLQSYSECLYDPGHYSVFQLAAFDGFKEAASKTAFFESDGGAALRKRFSERKKTINEKFDIEGIRDDLNKTQHSLGRSKAERSYRKWVLENRLFVNPLNDLGALNIASHDVLTLPPITLSLDKHTSALPPPIIGFFNQIKQEFVSARYFFFEGVQSDKAHFSDKGVLLYNTLDYPSHTLAVEKMRAAYRLAYSLFDKIAYFLNHYLEAGWPDEKVNFRNLWHEQKGKDPKPIRKIFVNRENWPLRGLYWLSKDLFEPDFKQTTEPDAEALADIRNFLEHKYLQLHESWGLVAVDEDQLKTGPGYHLSRDEFEAKTLRILKLARAALIYLSFAVHREEYVRHLESSENLTASIPLDTWEDKWKI